MANDQTGNVAHRLSVSGCRAALRTIVAAMFHQGIDVDSCSKTAKQELRDGINAVLELANEIDAALEEK